MTIRELRRCSATCGSKLSPAGLTGVVSIRRDAAEHASGPLSRDIYCDSLVNPLIVAH
jgi:hypothetical protein